MHFVMSASSNSMSLSEGNQLKKRKKIKKIYNCNKNTQETKPLADAEQENRDKNNNTNIDTSSKVKKVPHVKQFK